MKTLILLLLSFVSYSQTYVISKPKTGDWKQPVEENRPLRLEPALVEHEKINVPEYTGIIQRMDYACINAYTGRIEKIHWYTIYCFMSDEKDKPFKYLIACKSTKNKKNIQKFNNEFEALSEKIRKIDIKDLPKEFTKYSVGNGKYPNRQKLIFTGNKVVDIK